MDETDLVTSYEDCIPQVVACAAIASRSLAPPSPLAPWRPSLFRSFLMGGFESSSHRRADDGQQLDLIAATRHDEQALDDYRLLAACNLGTVRDALRWHLIEAEPGRYDWSSFLPTLRAARQAGVQVIWDLCHYGLPHGVDIWSREFLDRFAEFCAAVAWIVRAETDGEVPFYCPVNEINFWAWGGGDHARMYPYASGRGPELKRQLARAAIVAIEAVRSVEPRARFVKAEPLIHVTTPPEAPWHDVAGAAEHREAQFEAFDMIAGRLAPELGGSEAHLDIIGLNFYPDNQLFRAGDTIPLGHWLYRPLGRLLEDVYARYGNRPILLTETGAEGANGAGWLRYIGGEVRAALRAGVPVEGICIYPVMDYPGWSDGRHCRCGLIRAERDWSERAINKDLLDQLGEERMLLSSLMTGLAGTRS
ncbi:MAG: beta-glucosidase [Acetobacteraceae bacterium]|nr:beta-glucosidase [Acetobacteraceae bacterium]